MLPMSVRFHHWTLGFRQFSFDHIAQALQGHSLHVFRYALLYLVVSNRYMLLFPFPFGSRLVVHLGVICPELRPPPVAILSVRDTAHTFASHGSSVTRSLSLIPVSRELHRGSDRAGAAGCHICCRFCHHCGDALPAHYHP